MSIQLHPTPSLERDTQCAICQETPADKNVSWWAHPDKKIPVKLIHHTCLPCLKRQERKNMSNCSQCRMPIDLSILPPSSVTEEVGEKIIHSSELLSAWAITITALVGLTAFGVFLTTYYEKGLLTGTGIGTLCGATALITNLNIQTYKMIETATTHQQAKLAAMAMSQAVLATLALTTGVIGVAAIKKVHSEAIASVLAGIGIGITLPENFFGTNLFFMRKIENLGLTLIESD